MVRTRAISRRNHFSTHRPSVSPSLPQLQGEPPLRPRALRTDDKRPTRRKESGLEGQAPARQGCASHRSLQESDEAPSPNSAGQDSEHRKVELYSAPAKRDFEPNGYLVFLLPAVPGNMFICRSEMKFPWRARYPLSSVPIQPVPKENSIRRGSLSFEASYRCKGQRDQARSATKYLYGHLLNQHLFMLRSIGSHFVVSCLLLGDLNHLKMRA